MLLEFLAELHLGQHRLPIDFGHIFDQDIRRVFSCFAPGIFVTDFNRLFLKALHGPVEIKHVVKVTLKGSLEFGGVVGGFFAGHTPRDHPVVSRYFSD
nr:hypothetical protein [Thiolapillus sp.]